MPYAPLDGLSAGGFPTIQDLLEAPVDMSPLTSPQITGNVITLECVP